MSSTITFDAVTKSYPAGKGAGSGSPAVDSFTARIEAGTTTVLLGSSGCGKTTLLRMVNRMVEPSSGRVLIDDEDVATRDAVALRRSIGYVMQNAGLLPHRRVIDNITLVPRLQGMDRRDCRHRALELMDMLDLDRDLAERYPHQLSGGERQRVSIARALLKRAPIVLLDEATSALDAENEANIVAAMQELRRTSTLIVIALLFISINNLSLDELQEARLSKIISTIDVLISLTFVPGILVAQGVYTYFWAIM